MPEPLAMFRKYQAELPVRIFEMIREFGLELRFTDLPDNISGWIERLSTGGYQIVVNASHSLNRRRFTAAHELGHYIYHRNLLGAGTGDTRAYRSAGTPKPNAAITPTHERQANSVAANILMPRIKLADDAHMSTAELAKRYGVSEAAMNIRLGRR